IGLGGNFVRAVPETVAMEQAWRKLPLTVQILTKLNRSAVIHGRAAYLLPCLGRIEIDREESGKQFVTVEDTTGRFHASHGRVEPGGPNIGPDRKLGAGLAEATPKPNGHVDWQAWTDNYALIRDAISATYPAIFGDFNARIANPRGFDRPLPARQRIWK